MKNCDLIKSCERVRDLGEVFTPEHIVKNMCDLVPESVWNNIDSTFLEPACGNGNFMVEILRRKLDLCKNVSDMVAALKSIYGIDIMQDNVDECRCRLLELIEEKFSLSDDELKGVKHILDINIIHGDSLKMIQFKENDKNEEKCKLKFMNWNTEKYEYLENMVNKQQSLF